MSEQIEKLFEEKTDLLNQLFENGLNKKEVKERLEVVEAELNRAVYKTLEIHERWIKQIADKVGLTLQI